jgi:hypothetical protein
MTETAAEVVRAAVGVVLLLISFYVLSSSSLASIFELAGVEGTSEQVAMKLFVGLALLVCSVWAFVRIED